MVTASMSPSATRAAAASSSASRRSARGSRGGSSAPAPSTRAAAVVRLTSEAGRVAEVITGVRILRWLVGGGQRLEDRLGVLGLEPRNVALRELAVHVASPVVAVAEQARALDG